MTQVSTQTIFGGPTKRFFVSMLTRDIELVDAILDLVDNSVDGAMRSLPKDVDSHQPFKGFHVELSISGDDFSISDNCGGIPKDYLEDAFYLGRPNIQKDGDLPTVGMYGIGMKRAIFKLGKCAVVESNNDDGAVSVEYSSHWMDPENTEWNLPLTSSSPKSDPHGVVIYISELKEEISASFNNASFLNRLTNSIQEHFGYLMQRGFSVIINGSELVPKTLVLHNSEHSDESKIRAFEFMGRCDGVDIRVTVGFFRGLVKEAEIDGETEAPTETEAAGISVICNDRVILLADRTMKTGWGDAGVPRYHPQFRAIAGLIEFKSNDAEKLPISTTKRGLDAGSDVYLTARQAATEGLKTFTSFTNKWKGIEEETAKFFVSSNKTDVKSGISLAESHGVRLRGSDAKKYVPKLPQPDSRSPRKRVSFVKSEEEVRLVSGHLFDDPNQNPSIVGAECFDRMLVDAKSK